MTSVMDNVSKFSEYILTCRRMMGIPVLPPDINEGERLFRVGDAIRYGLSAIKSVGKPVTEVILAERERRRSLPFHGGFCGTMTMKEVNKRTLENFIKSGALDTLPGTRRQKMAVAPTMLEKKAREKNPCLRAVKPFDIAGEEGQERIPDYISRMWGNTQRMSFLPLRRRYWASISAAIPGRL